MLISCLHLTLLKGWLKKIIYLDKLMIAELGTIDISLKNILHD